jgi:translation initiation factor 2B subunit (eIF-2B alpha/beta/delta family)
MDWIDSKIEGIARDRRHGAAQLAGRAVEMLATLCRRGRASTPHDLARQVVTAALRVARTRPSMAPIHNWSLLFARRFNDLTRSASSLEDLRRLGVRLGEEIRAEQHRLLRQQVDAARPLLAACGSLVTLSYSSTVEAILGQALPRHTAVTIAESRPLLEGRRLFTRLLESRPSLRMVTDAQLGLAVARAELVLVGADSILSDLAVVNKTGTYLAALAAGAHQRGFFVAADTFKIQAAPVSPTSVLESRSGKEVWRRHGESCDNIYFDITPGHLVTGFVTELGILDGPRMAREVLNRQEVVASLGRVW